MADQAPRRRRGRFGCLGLVAAVVLLALLAIAAGGAVRAVTGEPALRGRMVDIGGRRLHLVCEGPLAPGPTVWLEAGAFGFSADWASVQKRLKARGIRSCAYDRAGLGRSDPGPRPRDGEAVVSDLEKLQEAADESGPYILVGHSMAGLYVRLYAARNARKVAGLVLVDAATPEASASGPLRGFVQTFSDIARLAGWTASAGLLKPLSFMGDQIGLEGAAAAEKRWAFGHGPHNRWAAEEVEHWMNTAEQARRAGPLDPGWPTAVVTAGYGPGAWNAAREAPAHQSSKGYVKAVDGAAHATLLGERFADEIVRAIVFVRDAASGPMAA